MDINLFLKDIDTIPLSWDYFVDFNKIHNIDIYHKEINKLNQLFLCDDYLRFI